MLKRILFTVAPMVLVASSVTADDNLLAKIALLNGGDMQSTEASLDGPDEMGQNDVDALLGDDEDASSEDAIAACFRRVGYGYNRHSYRQSYRSYGHNYSCYRPTYRHYNYCAPVQRCYTPVQNCYTPVHYQTYTPCYTSYWGCW